MRRSTKDKGFVLLGIVIIAIIILFITGWVKNVIKLTNLDFSAPYKTEIIRVVGVLPPVGGIVGWMTFEEEKD